MAGEVPPIRMNDLERDKWVEEIRLREREIDIKAIEVDIKLKEQGVQFERFQFEKNESRRNKWTNPLVLAVLAAAIAAFGNGIVAFLNGIAQRTVEQFKSDQALILESIKVGSNPDRAAENLRFLAGAALISNPERRAEILSFLERRRPGEGPALPSSNNSASPAVSGASLLQQTRAAIGLLTVNSKEQNGDVPRIIGTAFILNDQGYSITAAHLFPEQNSDFELTISLGSSFGSPSSAELISIDRDLGLALIRVRNIQQINPIKISPNRGQIAQTVSIIGFPAGSDLSLIIGNIYSVTEMREGIGVTAMSSPSMSGSPVFNEVGELIAVVIGGRTTGTVAIPIQLASSLLGRAGIGR